MKYKLLFLLIHNTAVYLAQSFSLMYHIVKIID